MSAESEDIHAEKSLCGDLACRCTVTVLDHKLGNNPNKDFVPTTEFAEELQQRTQVLIDKTKQNIMQSYLKNKE